MSRSKKQPWPTKAVMAQIYEQHLWGGNEFDFYSGEGSNNLKITEPYLKAVTTFLKSFDSTLSICDLGCGDFNIGKVLLKYSKSYIAIDIVDTLIERNKNTFTDKRLEFQCLDIAKDELPTADCAILRQVLQHLSNSEIKTVVEKLKSYTYLILTEHIPNGAFIANKDIISGQGIRLKHNSGVDLLESPFNLKVKKQSVLNTFVLDNTNGKIVTTLYTL